MCCGIVIICKIPKLINLIDGGVCELLSQLDFAADYHLGRGLESRCHIIKPFSVMNDPAAGVKLKTF